MSTRKRKFEEPSTNQKKISLPGTQNKKIKVVKSEVLSDFKKKEMFEDVIKIQKNLYPKRLEELYFS